MFEQLAKLAVELRAYMDANLGIWYYIILNAFGVIAIILKVTEVQLNNRKTILTFATFAALGWMLYFALNFDFTSAMSGFLSAIQIILFSQRGKHKLANSIFWLFFFLTLQIGFGILTFTSWRSIFPIVAGILGAFAYFVMDANKYRVFILFFAISWLMNSILNMYIVALLSDTFCFVSASIAIIRYNVLGKNKRQSKDLSTQEIEENELNG